MDMPIGTAPQAPVKHARARWQTLWFLLHLISVYVLVKFVTPWLAGWTRGTLLPLFERPTQSSSFEFLFSHLLAFSFLPAFLCGLINAKFKQKVAQFVWLVPTLILAYKFVTFPAPSVLQSQLAAAFHQYFGSEFVIGEFRNWNELFEIASTNSDMTRGMTQLQFTAPFYAGVGYSLAAWIGRRTDMSRKLSEKVKMWEQSRFERER